jgi:membrane-associated protein
VRFAAATGAALRRGARLERDSNFWAVHRMNWFKTAIDLVLHLDRHLASLVGDYGTWTYLLLFVIVFCETGLVVTPFLPGDSLLFAAGAIAALGSLNVHQLVVLLCIAAIAGDTVNYWIGAKVGPRAFRSESRWLNQNHLRRTQEFYRRHGGKAIILSRFVPIVRTFAPFVAGIGAMDYGRFLRYNVLGGVVWVAGFVYLGYFFGNREFVKKNFSLVIVAIVLISVVPIVVEYFRARREARPALAGDQGAAPPGP